MDMTLPFGLRSAPKIFNVVADTLQWIIEKRGVTGLHYLDDFFLTGRAGSKDCAQALEKALECCAHLGIPVAPLKTQGPTTKLVFLGIEIDTEARRVKLPEAKLHRLQTEIRVWQGRRACTKRELLSLIGQLQHACCVVRPGRTFLRRMINLSTVAKELHHRIRLNLGFRSDLQWWATFLPSWNGVGIMRGAWLGGSEVTMTSDASGSWGCGAFTSAGEWFQLQWPGSWADVHITVKELQPIVMGAAMWGAQWQGRSVKCRCDNAAVVAIIRSGSSREERVMHLMRCLFFFRAKFDLALWAEHLPGKCNGAADALSRDDRISFLSQVTSAQREPTLIPVELAEVLVHKQPDWTSRSWTELLKSSSLRA